MVVVEVVEVVGVGLVVVDGVIVDISSWRNIEIIVRLLSPADSL